MRRILVTLLAMLALASPAHAQFTEAPSPATFRNLLVCGDATTCPWQRGTASAVSNSATIAGDFWTAIGGSSSSITVSQVAQTGVNGYTKAIKFARTASNADTAVINMGQVLDSADAGTFLQGKNICVSFDSFKGADFSPSGGTFTYTVTSGTGSNQGYASMVAGTWTGTATVLTGTVAPTTAGMFTSQCGQVPANATEVGINFAWTPSGTAGTNDWIELNRIQLEAINQNIPLSKAAPTPFENRDAGTELRLALRRSYVLTEPAAGLPTNCNGPAYTTALADLTCAFPVPMRAAPTVSFAGTSLSASTFEIIMNSATPITLASTFLVQSAIASTNTTTYGVLKATGTSTPFTVGFACSLRGAGGGAKIIWAADLL